MKQNKIENLYTQFSGYLLEISETEDQKNKAVIISKVLWVLLITDHDTEEDIYTEMSKVVPNHDAAIGFGSVYLHKMKGNLTKKEIKNIRKHYSDTKKLDQLKHWIDDTSNNLN